MKRLFPYVLRRRGRLVWSLLFAMISSGLMLLTPYYIGRAVDLIVGAGDVDFSGVLRILALLLGMFVVSAAFQWCVTTISTSIAYAASCELRRDAFDKMNRMPVSYFDRTPHGDIMSRLTNDIDAISDGLLQGMTQLFMGILTFLGSLVLMFRLNVLVTLVILVITPAAFLVSSVIAKKVSKYFTNQSVITGELNAAAEEAITNSKLMKAYSLESSMAEQFDAVNDRLYTAGQKSQWYSSLINPTTRLINNFAYIAVGILGAILCLQGDVYLGGWKVSSGMTVGLVASFLAYASQFARPINDITSVSTQLQSAGASLKRVFEMVDLKPEHSGEPATLRVTKGAVRFQHVSFAYDPAKPLIRDLNITVPPGNIVAIVGSTGAGKTTLVNLLMRFYELDQGTIYIDGIDISTVSKDSLRTAFAMVLQDAVLFSGTIAENISYGRPDASMEEIIAAAKSAHIHKAILNLKYGYDTRIDGEECDLSAGQKQLLTIARAMLLDPKMLILDEATSSVDTLTELYIQRAFQKMMQGRTTFIIAHRLSTIENADQILVMEQGNVVEQGNHKELLTKNGFYANLYKSQFQNTGYTA